MARRFQGSAQYNVTASIAGSSLLTMACWTRSPNVGTDCTAIHLDNGTDTDSSRIGLTTGSNLLAVYVQHRTGVGSTAFLPNLNYDQWYHMALVLDGTNMLSYLDGVLVDTRAFNPALRTTAFTIFRIGDQFSGSGQDETLQDAVLFTSALGINEINELRLGRVPRTQIANLFGYWPLFNDSPLIDYSGKGHGLSLTGTVNAAQFNAPAMWARMQQRAMRVPFNSSATPITAAGTTNVTGAAAMGFSLAETAAGSTQTTGAAAMGQSVAETAAGSTQTTGAAAMGQSVAETSAGSTQTTGAAVVGISYAITAAGLTNVTGAASEGLTQPITAAGLTQTTGSAVEGQGVALTAAGLTQTTGAAAQGISIALTASGLTQTTGVAAEGFSAAIVAAGLTQTTGAAAMSSSSGGTPITGAGVTQVTGAAALGFSLAETSAGTTQTTGAAAMGQSVAQAAAGTTQVTGAAQMGIAQPITAAGSTQTTGAANVGLSQAASGNGLTQVTGAASMGLVYQITALGLTSTSGGSSGWAVAMQAAGLTQTSGFANMVSSAGPTGPATGAISSSGADRRLIGSLGRRTSRR